MTDPALDPLDDEILAVLGRLDPPPADLDAIVSFAIALDTMDAEVARLTADQLVGSGARGDDRTRTVTFETDERTIMVAVAEAGADRLRLDGWLAPPARLRVELRIAGGPTSSGESDDAGRFVFDRLPRGLAQLVVHADGARIVTPALRL